MDLSLVSIVDAASSELDHVTNIILEKYGLIIRSISNIDRSFERALSICLFGTEEEVQSISSTLYEQYDWSSHTQFNQDESYIMLAAQIYGITIHVHNNHSVKVYEIENDCPTIHLIKLQLKDGSYVYLATEKNSIINNDDENEINDTDEGDMNISNSSIKEDQAYVGGTSNDITTFKSQCSLNVTVRKIVSDGNCFFRSVSDQLTGSQHGHIILRQLIVDFISGNRQLFEISIDKEHFSCWDDFIYRMHQDGTFADGIVVAASVMFLRQHIIVHQHEQRPLLFKSSFRVTNHNQIHLAYNSKSLHYNSIWSRDRNRLHIEEIECISA